MPSKKYFNCKTCKTKHIKPIDELCPFNQAAQNAPAPVAQDPVPQQQSENTDSDTDTDIGTQILTEMRNFGTRLTQI